MKEMIKGNCLCGQVTFCLKNEFSRFFLCHCEQCRKITGSAYASNLFTSAENIEWTSGECNIKRFDDPERDFTKAFCTECGSGLPFVTKSGQALIVPAGSLNSEPNIMPQSNIFWADRALWDDVSAQAPHVDAFPES